METYLVTGGVGFIGSHLSEALIKKGHDVVVLDNFNPFYDPAIKEKNFQELQSHAKRLGRKLSLVRGDVRNAADVALALNDKSIAGVYHLAAMAGVRPSIENPALYWDVNCSGTATLLNAMKDLGIKRFVFASSSSVYGKNNAVPYQETMDVGYPISPYGASKRAGELLCHSFSHLHQIHTICIRFFTVYGPRQRPDLAIHKFAKKIMEQKAFPFFGDGTSLRDYTYVTDIVEGVIAAMEYSARCEYDIINLGESETISLKEMVSCLAQKIGKEPILDLKPVQAGDMEKTWADISKAKKLLGYSPKINKEEGLSRFVEWLHQNEQL